jgi:multiple sugar transport system ATP-binding protein
MFDADCDANGALRLANGALLGGIDRPAPGKVVVGVRPEDLTMRDDGQLEGRISLVEPTGPETYALVDLGATEITVRMSGLPNVALGAAVRVHVPPAAVHVFAADGGQRLN